MNRSAFHPVGPAGSILIGLVLVALHFAGAFPGVWAIGMLGWAFLLGGGVMLMVRIMTQKKNQLPK